MHHLQLIISFVLAAIFTQSCVSRPKQPGPPKPVAIIGNETIKQDDLAFALKLRFKNHSLDFKDDQNAYIHHKKMVLEEIIERKLVKKWGEKNEQILTPEEKAYGLEKMKIGYSKKEFEIMLKEHDIPLFKWKELTEEKILWQKIIEHKIYPEIDITEKEIKEFYDQNLEHYHVPEQVRVRHIVTDSIKKAKNIRDKILDGENFAKLAILHSLSPDRKGGGDLGFFSRGTHPIEFDNTCFKLKKGEISEIIKSPYGFHIFKLIKKRKSHTTHLREVKHQIKAELFQIKFDQLYRNWIEELKQIFPVKIYEENIENSIW